MKIGNVKVYGVIYKITNKINNKTYIGQTIRGFNKRYCAQGKGIERVYNYYKYSNDNGKYVNKHLFKSIKKYGFNSFDVTEVFDVAFSKKELDIKEECYIRLFNCINKGFNHTSGGNATPSLKGENNPMYGRPWWDENTPQEKIEEWKSKLDNSGKKNPMYGRQHSKESKEKNRLAHLGKNVGKDSPHAKEVICITTEKIFKCIKDASEYYKCNAGCIGQCCQGKRNYCGKLKDGTKLVWMYLEDYKKGVDE